MTTDYSSDNSKQKLSRTVTIIVITVLLTCALIYAAVKLLYVRTPRTAFAFELGENINTDPSFYIEGGELALALSEADFSKVNTGRPGIYPMTIHYLWMDYDFDIAIVDSIAPEIRVHDGPLYFEQGTELKTSDFIESVVDADRNLDIRFNTDLMENSSLSCEFLGTYSAWLIATDSSGNSSKCSVDYVVDLPPEIGEVGEFYYVIGSDDTILNYVTAYDQTDGDLSSRITLSDNLRNITFPADMELTLSVTDSCGFTATKPVMVHADTLDSIQNMIAEKELSRHDYQIIGAMNLYDNGIFHDQTMEETLIDVMPTVTDIRINERNGSITTGSGFIIEIRDGFIYIVTNEHVVNDNSQCEIFFYTGDHVFGKVVGVDNDYDVAVIKVPLSNLPESFEDRVATVHIDMTYWDTLNDEPIELGLEKMGRNGNIEHYTYGTLVRKLQSFAYFIPHIQTEMALKLHLGDSGSAIFDVEGRLIGMAFAYSVSPERDWAVPLSEIVSAYVEITGNELYTY